MSPLLGSPLHEKVLCTVNYVDEAIEKEIILPTTQKKYLDDLYLINPDVFLNTEVSKLLPY